MSLGSDSYLERLSGESQKARKTGKPSSTSHPMKYRSRILENANSEWNPPKDQIFLLSSRNKEELNMAR